MNKLVIVSLCSVLCIYQSAVYAQSFRYMDKAGNIFWVDSIDQVPREYLDQVVKPTPKPVLSKKQQRQVEAEKKRIQKEKEKAEKTKEKKKKHLEKERQKKLKEKERKAKEGGGGVEEAPGPSAKHEASDPPTNAHLDSGNPSELEDDPEGE